MTTATNEQIEITLTDITVAASVIDLAVKRGAIQAGEMATVGATYNKLVAFLNRVKEASEQAATQAAEATETAPAADEAVSE